jgi:hypothetical protein
MMTNDGEKMNETGEICLPANSAGERVQSGSIAICDE